MRRIIRLGDSTSHGGKVVSATSHMTVGGLPVARLGDKCTCPKRGHNNCVIVEGDTNWTIDGIPVALEGHKLSCGGVLISSMPNAGRDEAGGGAAANQGASPTAGVFAGQPGATNNNRSNIYDEQLKIIGPDTSAHEGLPYRIETADGKVLTGTLAASGLLPRVDTEMEDTYHVFWGDDALARGAGL